MSDLRETLVGRTSELGSLDLAITAVERDGAAGLALVGEPGIGKTRLLGFAIVIGLAVRMLVAESPVRAQVRLDAGGAALLGLGWGVILTGIASVVIRSAAPEKTAVAVAVNSVQRNTSVAVGAQVAFAIVTGAHGAGGLPADSGYTVVFALGAAGAALLLLASATMPGRRSLS